MKSPQASFMNLLQSGSPIQQMQLFQQQFQSVRNMFYDLMGCESQNLNQVCSKWHDLRLKCIECSKIYNLNNLHKSKSSDFNVFKATLDQYEKIMVTQTFSISQIVAKIEGCSKMKKANLRNFINIFRFEAFKKPRYNFSTIRRANTHLHQR
uniref:Uncharacterized protein n=1 Tax=Lactuca sativa TaxID=4236 RepID=A0A9R1VCE8_LACSA|nr:hypothetical protein LSAT_V11C500279720 [Lactuca sativa]